MRIGLIGYNFEHRKTQDFIFRILSEGFKISLILAANKKKLNIPSSSIRKTIRFKGLSEPKSIASNLGIPYQVVDHDSIEMVEKIEESELDLGVISGARILSKEVINAFKFGIINFHPGLLPEVRGLDSILWSIYRDIPLGVTSHLIDHKIDAGKIICKDQIQIESDDTLFDLYEKVYSLQLNLISKSIHKVHETEFLTTNDFGKYSSKMSEDIELEVLKKMPLYILKYSN